MALRMVSRFFCKFTMYFIYLTPAISSWLTVLISFDRFLSIVKPSKFMFRKKAKYQILASVLVVFYNSLFLVIVIFDYEYKYKYNYNSTNSNYSTNYPKCKHYSPTIDIIDVLNSSLIPFIFMIIFTIYILKTKFESTRKIHHQSNNNDTKRKDVPFAITSISLTISFILLKFPHMFFSLLLFLVSIDDDSTERAIYTLFSILHYSQHGSVFYLSLITNLIFRKEFVSFISF